MLLDRDGTLIVDVPYNGDPEQVRAMPGAREAVERLRRAGVPLAMVSNQSGVARGLLTESQVQLVNQELGACFHWRRSIVTSWKRGNSRSGRI